MINIYKKRKELEEFKDLVKRRIDHDIFVPREMVTIDGKDLYKLFDILDDYSELLDLFIAKPITESTVLLHYFNGYDVGHEEGIKYAFQLAEKIHPGIITEIIKNENSILMDSILKNDTGIKEGDIE